MPICERSEATRQAKAGTESYQFTENNLPNKGPLKSPLGLQKGSMFYHCSTIFHTLGRSFNLSNHWQPLSNHHPFFQPLYPLFRQPRHSSISTCPELSLSTILKTLSIKRRSSCKTPPAPALKIRLLLPQGGKTTNAWR